MRGAALGVNLIVSDVRTVAGLFVGRGPHLGATAVMDQARAGLRRAGLELDAAAVPTGEAGSAALLVRQVGGRVYQLERRGFEDGHFAILPDRTAVIDGSCVIHHSTMGVAQALQEAAGRGAANAWLLLPSGLRHDGGRGFLDAYGDAKSPDDLPLPLLHLHTRTRTPDGGAPDFPWSHLVRTTDPASRLADVLGLRQRVAAPGTGWTISNASRPARSLEAALLDWVVAACREAHRPLWVLVAEGGRQRQEVLQHGPLRLYPITREPMSVRQLERRERHLLREAAYRLGLLMAAGDRA